MSNPNLQELCKLYASQLETPDGLDGEVLLRAIARIESSNGVRNIPRFESAYSIGGYYYRRSKQVQSLWATFGDHASCSYSSWQIMFVTAYELGYRGSPAALWHDHIAAPVVVSFINRRIFRRGATDLTSIGDAYNSGSFADSLVPEAYIKKLKKAYADIRTEMRAA